MQKPALCVRLRLLYVPVDRARTFSFVTWGIVRGILLRTRAAMVRVDREDLHLNPYSVLKNNLRLITPTSQERQNIIQVFDSRKIGLHPMSY